MEIEAAVLSLVIQMTLVTWLWILLGLRYERPFYRYVLFIGLSSLSIILTIPLLDGHAYLGALVIYLIVLIYGKLIFSKSNKDTLLDLFTIQIIFFCIQSLQPVMYKLVFKHYLDYQSYIGPGMVIAIANIPFLLFVVLVHCSAKLANALNEFKNALKDTPIMAGSFFLVFVIENVTINIYKDQLWNNLYVFTIGIGILYAYNFLGIRKAIELSKKKKAIEAYNQHYLIFSNLITDIKKKQHEFNNHLNTIHGLIQLGGEEWTEEIRQYIQSIKKNAFHEERLVALENRVLAAVIYSKHLEADEKKIDFEYELNSFEKYPVADYELVEILCNLLNNAFEAVGFLKDRKKHVILEMGLDEDGQYIEIKNNGPKIQPREIEDVFRKGYTTKGQGRGFGLYNVAAIATKNSGRVEVFFDGEYTVFKVIFCKGLTNSA